jgi:hypothetical protein
MGYQILHQLDPPVSMLRRDFYAPGFAKEKKKLCSCVTVDAISQASVQW